MVKVRIALASVAFALASAMLISDAFLVYWRVASQGQRDIEARGGILLGILLPYVALFSAVVTIVLVLSLARLHHSSRLGTILVALLGALLALATLFLDPNFYVMRLLAVPSLIGRLIVLVIFFLIGVFALRDGSAFRRAT